MIPHRFQLVNPFLPGYSCYMKWTTLIKSAPATPGVYAIYLDGSLVYIGYSSRLRRRIVSHSLRAALKDGVWRGIPFSSCKVKFKTIDCKTKAQEVECGLIRRLRPRANVKGRPGAQVIKVGKLKIKPNPNFRSFVDEMGGQANVARLLGLSTGHVSLLYNGKRRVTVDVAERVHIASKGKYRREELVFSRPQPRLPKDVCDRLDMIA